MQALRHFLYYQSDGRRVVCDLQGGYYAAFYVLTGPVVRSVVKAFGAADCGAGGIVFLQRPTTTTTYCDCDLQRQTTTTSAFDIAGRGCPHLVHLDGDLRCWRISSNNRVTCE